MAEQRATTKTVPAPHSEAARPPECGLGPTSERAQSRVARADSVKPAVRSYVVNRHGRREPLRLDKITDRNENLCSAAFGRELQAIDAAYVTRLITPRFHNGQTTRELDLETVRVCAGLSTTHRDYAALAARIVVSDLQKDTSSSFAETVRRLNGEPPQTLAKARPATESRPAATRLSEEFVAIVRRFETEIDTRIDYARDFRFGYFGIETMKRSYLFRAPEDRERILERPQHTYMRVAIEIWCCQADGRGHLVEDSVARVRLENAFHVYDLLSLHKITHASPTMFNAGTKHRQLSSCFLLRVDDDLEVLYDVVKNAGMISKWAGGIGLCLTPMRAEGGLIKSSGGMSSGIQRYTCLQNYSQLYANQGGLRPGAYASYLEIWHADVFIHIKMGRLKGPLADDCTVL